MLTREESNLFTDVCVTFGSELILDDNQKCSLMTGALLFVLGSCHSKSINEVHVPLSPIPKEDTPRC